MRPTTTKLYLGLLSVILVMACISALRPMPSVKDVQQTEWKHICIDPKHISCDGQCSCDGMECPKVSIGQLYDYQIDVRYNELGDRVMDLYNDGVLINTMPFTPNSKDRLGSRLFWTIIEDNE